MVKKTNTAMVIGLFDEGVQPGDCNVVVENLGDYLIGALSGDAISVVPPLPVHRLKACSRGLHDAYGAS